MASEEVEREELMQVLRKLEAEGIVEFVTVDGEPGVRWVGEKAIRPHSFQQKDRGDERDR